MLEAIRRNSRSTIIYVLFTVLIAVFVINFGPGSNGGCGKALSTSYAARVSGSTISEQDYRMAYIALGGPNIPPAFARERHLKEFVMDKLIERELLAQEAEKLGFRVSDKEVEDLLATGKMYILGVPRKADEFMNDGAFDYKRFQMVVENRFGVNVQRFIEVQRHEMLADEVKRLMLGGVKVTPAEAKQVYEQKENMTNLEFVRFLPRAFEDKVEITDDEIDAYRKKHADEIKGEYDERSFLFKKVEKQAHVRLIVASVAKDEQDPDVVKKAERKAEHAKAKLGEKGVAFATVAKEASDDETSRNRGGDLGWRKKGFTGLSKELDEKVFAAAPGTLIGPERTDRGFEVVRVENFREGDIPLEQVAGEIAEEKVRTEKAKQLAKEAAEKAVADAKASGKPLQDLFPKPAAAEETDAAKKKAAQTPVAEETGLFERRGGLVPMIGVSSEVMKAAFSLKQGTVSGPYDVSDSWVVLQIREHRDPDMKKFEENKDDTVRQLQRQKWAEVLDDYSKQRCVEARDAGRIKWNDDVLSYDTEGGPATETKYVPCGNRL